MVACARISHIFARGIRLKLHHIYQELIDAWCALSMRGAHRMARSADTLWFWHLEMAARFSSNNGVGANVSRNNHGQIW